MEERRWRMVVLDDDPTGIQTVHGCLLITQWNEESIRQGFADDVPFFYILTNTRAMTREEAAKVTREAMEMAQQFDGISKNLTVVYFFNQDFETDGNTVGYDSGSTRILSARAWMMSLPMETMERRLIEKRMLTLISLLYNEHLDWHFDRIERVAINPPFYGSHMKEQKKALKQKKGKKNKKNQAKQGLPWYERITRTLLEDALNVLADEPKTHADIFHFLCAANMVNAYVNQCKHKSTFSNMIFKSVFVA